MEIADSVDILTGFFNLNRVYWKIGDPLSYCYYLQTLLPKGYAVKSENKYYFVSGDEVYLCGSDPDEFNKYKRYAKYHRSQEISNI